MSSRGQPVITLFHILSQYSAALRKRVGPDEATDRLKLVQELLAHLPHRCLLTTTKAEIQAAGRMMKAAGRSPQQMRALQSTLLELLDQLNRAGALPNNPVRDSPTTADRRQVSPRVALIVGVPGSHVEEIREALASVGVSSIAVATHEQAKEVVVWFPFAYVLGSLPSFAPVRFLETIRGAGSLCRNTGFVLLSEDDQVREASSFVGRGVNRVVAISGLAASLPKVISDLGKVSQRLSIKLKVQVELADGKPVGKWRSENISSTGMLILTTDRLAIGSQLDLRFTVPDDPLPIQARAEVVRSATFGRERFTGFGLRFLSFVGDGQHRLDALLHKYAAS